MREWGQLVAEDLFRPRFRVSRAYALRKRLLRNYWRCSSCSDAWA
jgi:uncharacterized membrane protein